jgi:hypothetical protein
VVSANGTKWGWIFGAATLAAMAAASLMPANWQLRTGLNWQIEHFLVYFLAATGFCLAWPRPFVVAGALVPFAAVLEALQGLTPDRVPDLPTALSGAGGVLSAALLAKLVIEARKGVLRAPIGPSHLQPQALAQPEEI